MARHSSKRWLARQKRDRYVQSAKANGYRSRALFKLQELQERDSLITSGMTVVDLGAAPGGWSQYLVQQVGAAGQVFALDRLPMPNIPGVEFIQGDFNEDEVLAVLLKSLEKQKVEKVDLVLSDMAPNISGVKAVDQPRSMALVKSAYAFAEQVLKPGGALVLKVFQGAGSDDFVKSLRQSFSKVVIRKPQASRNESCEVYVLARGYQDKR